MKLLSLCTQWKKHSSSTETESMKRFSLRVFKYEELKKATKDFSSEVQLGNGCFGPVYLGVLPDSSTHVAVRKLPNIRYSENFYKDVWSVKFEQHVNLVRLIGYCSEGDDIRLLVFDYFPNRSLDLHLFEQPVRGGVVLDWNMRYHIALGTARALEYLNFYHGNLKPENIILDSNFCPKVSDYGLPLLLGSDEFYKILLAKSTTSYYVALERNNDPEKCDVYSLGMVLFELVSGIRNSENGETPKSFPTRVASAIRAGGGGDILSLLDSRLDGDGSVDEEDVLRVCKVACWCVHDDPHDRPRILEVVSLLEGATGEDDYYSADGYKMMQD